MKKALLLAPMASVHRRFNKANIAALQLLGYEVHLAANFADGEGSEAQNSVYREACEKAGIQTHSIPFVRAVGRKNFGLVKELRALMASEPFSLIHAHTETGGLLLRMAMLLRKKTYRAVYTPHGMSFYKGSGWKSQLLYRPIEKWICGRMDQNIAMNREEWEVLQKWNKHTACFTHGIGVELTRFADVQTGIREELGLEKSTLLITAVGELNENKNHGVILNALAEAKAHDFCFVICGVGELRENLTARAEALGLGERVKLLGYRSDIPQILAGSDIFVFPSYHEGLPVSVMEAMAAGLPVVCSRIRGNVDLIEEGKGGFLYAPDDAAGFAQGLQALMADRTLGQRMGQHNGENSALYGLDSVKNELKAIYKDR